MSTSTTPSANALREWASWEQSWLRSEQAWQRMLRALREEAFSCMKRTAQAMPPAATVTSWFSRIRHKSTRARIPSCGRRRGWEVWGASFDRRT